MREREILQKYVPGKSVDYLVNFLKNNNVLLKINKERTTKLGDFRPPSGRQMQARITINQDLNKYQFLLTFLHEEAHYHIWKKYKNKVAPHGKEWQELFRKKVFPFLTGEYFPEEILPQLIRYFSRERIGASSGDISRLFEKYTRGDDYLTLEDIPDGSSFRTDSGRKFIKGKKLRTYYLCTEISTGWKFRVYKNAEVQLLHGQNIPGSEAETDKNPHKNSLFEGQTGKAYPLKEIPKGAIFETKTGQQFRKGRLLRTYYECFLLPGGEVYRVHGLAKVKLIRI